MNYTNAALMAGALVLAAGVASANSYRWSQWQPGTGSTSIMNKWFTEEVCKATGGEVCFDFFSDAAILPAKSHLQGIGDGVVQGGTVTATYTPSELPLSNALSAYFFIEPDPTTIGAAYADWVMHDPAGLQEWGQHNIVPFGGFAGPGNPFICNTSEPITELEQLRGLKVRFPGGPNASLAQHLGAVPVNIPGPEIYQALQNGQIDCASIITTWLNIENKLVEVSKSTTLMNWAATFTSPLQAINKDFWKSLTDGQRAEMIRLAAATYAGMQVKYNVEERKALDDAMAVGHVVVEPGDSIRQAVADWVEAGVGDMAGVATSAYGVQDPEALFASFQPYVEKWRALMVGVDKTSEEALTQVFYDNIFKDLDPATYGMN